MTRGDVQELCNRLDMLTAQVRADLFRREQLGEVKPMDALTAGFLEQLRERREGTPSAAQDTKEPQPLGGA